MATYRQLRDSLVTTLQPEHILETLVIPTGERSVTIRGGQRP
jgi:hypothetical protein